MPSTVNALVITCMDAPLHRSDKPYLSEYLRGKHVGLTTWDLVAVPGGVRDVVTALDTGTKDLLVRAVKMAHDVHGVSKIILVNHSGCTVYEGASFPTVTDEYRKHAEDLRAARDLFRQTLPNLDVRLFFATVEDRADGPFVTFDEVR